MPYLKGLIWMIRKFGLKRTIRYESFRKKCERQLGRKFDPKTDGEPLLRACGYDDGVIKKFKDAGLA